MASPFFNELSLRLARAVEDPVATAAANGDVLDSTDRNDYLNRAIKEFLQGSYFALGRRKMQVAFQKMVTPQTIAAIASAGVAVATDYADMPIDFKKTGSTAHFILKHSKVLLDNDRNPHIDAAFVVEGGLLFVYQNNAILNAGAGFLYYISHIDRTADYASDTPLPVNMWDIVVDLAAALFYLDIGQGDKVQALKYGTMQKAIAGIGNAVPV